MKRANESNCCGGSSCGDAMNRRDFVRLSASGVSALAATHPWTAIAGPFDAKDTIQHFVPLNKKLKPDWVQKLFAKGEPTWYEGDDLNTIGMPVGGVAAGQVYLGGDGRLLYWGIFNQYTDSGYGAVNYKAGARPQPRWWSIAAISRPAPEIDQGAALHVRDGERSLVRSLDRKGFPRVRFCGEYPLGYVEYRADDFPVEVQLEAFSPFIPLNTDDSSLPATCCTTRSITPRRVPSDVTLAGWLAKRRAAIQQGTFVGRAVRVNEIVQRQGQPHLASRVRATDPVERRNANRSCWRISRAEITATGRSRAKRSAAVPPRGTLASQQDVSGFRGKGLVNTYLGGE